MMPISLLWMKIWIPYTDHADDSVMFRTVEHQSSILNIYIYLFTNCLHYTVIEMLFVIDAVLKPSGSNSEKFNLSRAFFRQYRKRHRSQTA